MRQAVLKKTSLSQYQLLLQALTAARTWWSQITSH